METFQKVGSRQAIATEAGSLRWLEAVDGAAVARLRSVSTTWLTTALMAPGTPSREDAARFGRGLALTHAAGAAWWGQPPPGVAAKDLTLAELPAPGADEPLWGSFGEFFAEARTRPYVELADFLPGDHRSLLHRACDIIGSGRFDAPQPARCPEVARIHGDLWGGNVVWASHGNHTVGTMIDACAHGGHAETDLADLALFGSPHLDATIEGYNDVSPLADGWRARVPVHQFHKLLVHVVLFQGAYVPRALDVAAWLVR
jgi:fructosamine-3-kinase